jgi:hypothetical protein
MQTVKTLVMSLALAALALPASGAWAQSLTSYGSSPQNALENCQSLYSAGVAVSGTYWIKPVGENPRTAYCDMETNGGGWTLVYNSVLGVNTTDFWNISYCDRLGRRGRPDIGALFYDGGLYLHGRLYMDVIEDLNGRVVVALQARASGIDTSSMRFISPSYLSGYHQIYIRQFASGWSSPDYDGDTDSDAQCSTHYANVTQHYESCWVYNLGADADMPFEDGRVGPHLNSTAAAAMGLTTDGSGFTRVRRISRFVKW